MFAPSGTPAPILRRLNGLLHTWPSRRSYSKDEMRAMGTVPRWIAPEDAPALMAAEQNKWADAAKKAGTNASVRRRLVRAASLPRRSRQD